MSKKIIYTALTIIWILVIFSFSLQPGNVSGALSSGFGKWLMENVLFGLREWFESLSVEQLELLHTILRKCAHFSEYFVLGVLMTKTLKQWRAVRLMLTSVAGCVVVASIDETIQLFVDGRSGQLTDVLLDGLGSFTGICVLYFVGHCINLWASKRNK